MDVRAWLAGHITYPTYEWLRGRATLRELAKLQHQAAQTADALRKVTAAGLRDLMVFANERLPYYRALFESHGVDPSGCSTVTDHRRDAGATGVGTHRPGAGATAFDALSRLPVLNKADIRRNADGLVWRDVPGGAIAHSSGGTSGDTLHFYIDRTRQAQTHAARLFMQQLFGVQPGQRRVHLWGSPIENRRGTWTAWRDRLLNEFVLNAFDMSPAQMDVHLDRLERLRPRLLYGYPSALALLARHAVHRRDAGAAVTGFDRLRLIVMTGEEITSAQRAQVRQIADCPIVAEYGSRETGLIAHECPQGGLHILSTHVHLEIERDGHTAPAGACGDILCTTLNTRAQPLIRYRIGDAGSLIAGGCACGLPFPLMRIAGGKVTGFIALRGGRLCHGAITSHILRDQLGIIEFKTHQRTMDLFEIRLVVNDDFQAGTIERVRRRYRELFGPQVVVNCRIVDRIPPDPSGKRRYVISDVVNDVGTAKIVDPTKPESRPLECAV